MRVFTLLAACLIGASVTAGTTPELKFIDAYKSAHSHRDLTALRNLSYLERVPADDPSISDPRFYNFDEPIKSIRIVRTTAWPPNGSCDPATFFVKSGVRQEFTPAGCIAAH